MPTTRAPSTGTLTLTAWTDCGTTPCYIQATGPDPVRYVIDTAAPSATNIDDVPAHILVSDGDDLADANVTLTGQKVYARGRGFLTVSR